MNKPDDPRELAIDLLDRSICTVQVAAVIADNHGIFAWGWNNMGADGLGIHAEDHAIRRSSRQRLSGATIYVASRRRRNEKVVLSKPCPDCAYLVGKWGLRVIFRDASGEWVDL